MRLNKKIVLFFLLFTIFFFKDINVVTACDCGELCEHCATGHWNTSYIDWGCPEGSVVIIYCQDQTDGAGAFEQGTTGTYWSPKGYSTVTCTNDCSKNLKRNEITECYDYIGECIDPDWTPTPGDGEGGGGGGGSDPTPTPTPVTSSITGSIQEDNGAALSGNVCTQASNNPVTVNNPSISSGAYTGVFSTSIPSNYTITRSTGTNYTVTLDLSSQTGLIDYICSCPAALDPDNPYICQYTGISAPSENINFYLQARNLSSDSWFQVFGGNVFGQNGVSSVVPYTFCGTENNCQAALNATLPSSTNVLSSGFAVSNLGDSSGVSSYDHSNYYHSYFHLPGRTSNLNSYDVNTDLSQLSYDYFYKLAENSIQTVGNGQDLKPLLSDWTNSSWWITDDVNYVGVNGNLIIDETQAFNVASSQQLVIFVDGDLTLNDSNIADANRKITSVAQGGFLAFFASGDIIVSADVGYELDPLNPTTLTVSNANSNLEGVFVANNNLVVQSKTAIGGTPPDRKFIGAGTFVGWNNVLLNRTFDDDGVGPILSNYQAVENFIYRPDLLANWPVKMKASTSNWREVDPQFINQ